MSKNRSQPPPKFREGTTPQAPSSPRSPTGKPHIVLRVLVSLMALWHLFAVFMAPLSLPPTSQLAVTIAQGPINRAPPLKWFEASPMQWYLDALYLNHGYSFFAPSPGPGHLVRFHVTDEHGQVTAEGKFPDFKELWPRLRYHRHLMLADQAELPLPGREPAAAQRLVLDGYARHLLGVHGGSEARLTRVKHYMLSPQERIDGVKLDAPHKYETVMEVVQRTSDSSGRQPSSVGRQVELGARNFTLPVRRTR